MTTGYSAQTEGALLCIEAASDWALTCVDELAVADSHVLIDYGAADGGTAVGLWNQVLDRLHANQPQAHLTLIGNDLPSNDNIALANNLALQIPRDPKPTVLVSARSFYEPSVAPNSVSFGFSATAMHWLSASPGPLNSHTHVLASGDADALQRFTAQAMKDWNHILELRSRELKLGGRLLTVNLSRDEAGLYLGHNGGETRNVHDQLQAVAVGGAALVLQRSHELLGGLVEVENCALLVLLLADQALLGHAPPDLVQLVVHVAGFAAVVAEIEACFVTGEIHRQQAPAHLSLIHI